MIKPFLTYRQLDSMDCGSTCLRMIAKYYGRAYSIQNLREKAFITREGVSMLGISEAAEAIGFRTQGVWITVEDKERDRKRNLGFFFRYISPYRREMAQLVLGMVTASVLQLILPFLTQSLVDTGIRDNNLSFITLILISQLVIFIAKLSVDFIRSWILLHVNTRINIALISDFLAKLMRLPLHFFDTKMVGDIMQRIGDHDRIEAFMTCPSRPRRKPPRRS